MIDLDVDGDNQQQQQQPEKHGNFLKDHKGGVVKSSLMLLLRRPKNRMFDRLLAPRRLVLRRLVLRSGSTKSTRRMATPGIK